MDRTQKTSSTKHRIPMNSRRSFLGSVLGFVASTPFLVQAVEPKQRKLSDAMRRLNGYHRVFNCNEAELYKFSLFVWGDDFTIACPTIKKIDRDLEKVIAVFHCPSLDMKQTLTVHGCGLLDPEGFEIARAKYCSVVQVVNGDTLNHTYTLNGGH